MRTLLGEDAALLQWAGVDTAALEALERTYEGALELPGRGTWWDAHVHLGRDADGHRLDAGRLFADLDRWGVAGAVCFPANDPGPDGSFGAANAAVIAASRRSGGRIVPFCRLDPSGPWEVGLARAVAGGARGLKLHPIAQRFAPESPACVALVRAATALDWPVLIHAGYGARPLAGPLARLVDEAPGCRLILAHGARGDARAVREALAGRPGVMLDTSLASLPDLVELAPSVLCFGSDRPYGEHLSGLHLVATAARVAGWSGEDLAGVLGGNLRRWLGQGV